MGALIILGIIAVMFIIFIANIQPEDKKEQSGVTLRDIKDRVEQWQKLPNRSEEDMVIEYIKSFKDRISDWNKQGDLLEIDGELYEVQDTLVDCYDYLKEYKLMIPNLVYMSMGCYGLEEGFLARRQPYKISGFSLESVQELEKSLNECKVVKSTLYKMKEKFTRITDGWYSINGGEYYLEKGSDFNHRYFQKINYRVYKFEDWSTVDISRTTFDIEELTRCENPKQTHWKHFLEIKMKAKKKREDDCHKFVDEVLSQQKEYNDLQLQYEMMPSAPISDVVSFNNFCKVVSKNHGFKDYEIQNYLMLKQGGLKC